MNSVKKPNANGNPGEIPGLAAYKCPLCHSVTWSRGQSGAEVLCQFCSDGLPAYLTRIQPIRMIMCNETPQNSEMAFNDASRQSGGELPGEGDWASPFTLEFFMVQGSGFRCMAYRNRDGKWREAFDHEELPGAIRVLE